MVYFKKKSMEAERRERMEGGGENPEIRVQTKTLDRQERTLPSAEENVDAQVAERLKAAEKAARATREMEDHLLVRIEELLSHGLADEYAALTQEKKQEFKREGEQLARWLRTACAQGSVKSHEVLTRLETWLLIIEGKDRASPWLLQEAFTRARRLMREIVSSKKGH
jgi:hypothetical protein